MKKMEVRKRLAKYESQLKEMAIFTKIPRKDVFFDRFDKDFYILLGKYLAYKKILKEMEDKNENNDTNSPTN